MARPKNTPEQNIAAFWKRVDKRGPSDCWPWLGWIQKNGYGKFRIGHKICLLPHRFAFTISIGPIPDGLLVCHRCDNRKCCNPAHLFLGTHLDNTHDAMKKGRLKSQAKVTLEQVEEIRLRYIPYRNVKNLAQEFGIDPKHVWAIAHGRARNQFYL